MIDMPLQFFEPTHCWVTYHDIVRLLLPRLSHLTAHIIIQANSMGLIPKTEEQHLIENNNLNQNNKQQNKKLKQPKQYNRP